MVVCPGGVKPLAPHHHTHTHTHLAAWRVSLLQQSIRLITAWCPRCLASHHAEPSWPYQDPSVHTIEAKSRPERLASQASWRARVRCRVGSHGRLIGKGRRRTTHKNWHVERNHCQRWTCYPALFILTSLPPLGVGDGHAQHAFVIPLSSPAFLVEVHRGSVSSVGIVSRMRKCLS